MRIFFFLISIPSLLFATSNPGFFKNFPNRHFVETGSYEGEGIDEALRAGFHEIYSIELSENYYLHCKEKFAENSHVHLWQGDSSIVLEKVIASIQEPITFWLDGHYSDAPTARGSTNTPILQELETIKRHPIKTHTILIDDVRLFGEEEFDYIPLSQIYQLLLEINPNYRITFADGYRKNDILIAYEPIPILEKPAF